MAAWPTRLEGRFRGCVHSYVYNAKVPSSVAGHWNWSKVAELFVNLCGGCNKERALIAIERATDKGVGPWSAKASIRCIRSALWACSHRHLRRRAVHWQCCLPPLCCLRGGFQILLCKLRVQLQILVSNRYVAVLATSRGRYQ